MGDRHGLFGLAQDARPRIALRQMNGFGQGGAQQGSLAIGIGAIAGRSIMATSTPSSEVPLIRPSVVNIIAVNASPSKRWRRPAGRQYPVLSSLTLCPTGTSYNATARRFAAVGSGVLPAICCKYRKTKMIRVEER
jgi:hypothetical protein